MCLLIYNEYLEFQIDYLIVYGCDDARVYQLNITLTGEYSEVFCEVKTNGSKWMVRIINMKVFIKH